MVKCPQLRNVGETQALKFFTWVQSDRDFECRKEALEKYIDDNDGCLFE